MTVGMNLRSTPQRLSCGLLVVSSRIEGRLGFTTVRRSYGSLLIGKCCQNSRRDFSTVRFASRDEASYSLVLKGYLKYGALDIGEGNPSAGSASMNSVRVPSGSKKFPCHLWLTPT